MINVTNRWRAVKNTMRGVIEGIIKGTGRKLGVPKAEARKVANNLAG